MHFVAEKLQPHETRNCFASEEGKYNADFVLRSPVPRSLMSFITQILHNLTPEKFAWFDFNLSSRLLST